MQTVSLAWKTTGINTAYFYRAQPISKSQGTSQKTQSREVESNTTKSATQMAGSIGQVR